VDQKRTSSCCFTLGSSMVSWCSGKQSSVALSIAEEEYIALSVVVREAVWLHKLLKIAFDHEMDPTISHCDNQSCVKLSENPMFHDRSKQIEIKYHYIRDMVQRKAVHCNTFLHMSRLQISSPKHFPRQSSSTSVRDLA
jgi:hypothetical protein